MIMDYTMEPISTALRELCDMRGISGAELWARAGVSKATLSRYVHGSRGRAPDNRAARTIIKLARVLEVEPDYFLEYRVWRLMQLARLDPEAATASYNVALDLARAGDFFGKLEALERELDDDSDA